MIIYTANYDSPLGTIVLTADEIGLTGLRFENENRAVQPIPVADSVDNSPVLDEARRWLDIYFCGKVADFVPALHLNGSAFQLSVWSILQDIPYGKTATYGAIAREIALRRNLNRMSAQAVGGAVGRNPVAIIIPCHRVIGSDGGLTGYAAGIERKTALLHLEGILTSDSAPPVRYP